MQSIIKVCNQTRTAGTSKEFIKRYEENWNLLSYLQDYLFKSSLQSLHNITGHSISWGFNC